MMIATFLCISALCLVKTYDEGEAARLPWDFYRFSGLLLSFFWPVLVLCSLAAALLAPRARALSPTAQIVPGQNPGLGR
jgi:hypothetical protein